MKYFLLIGGFIGFASVICGSFYAGNHPAVALRDACVACILGGVLFRFLHSAFISGIRGHLAERARMIQGQQSSEAPGGGAGRQG